MCKIAINTYALDGKIPKGDRMWGDFNDRFENVDIDRMEIANAIYTGHAYTGWHEGRRNLENFKLAQHLAIDMDTDDERSSIATLEQHMLVRSYAAIIHTTDSHTTQTPRARIIFILDECIASAEAWKIATLFLMAQFDGPDTGCQDASRFFYGSKGADIWIAPNILPLAQLRHYYRRWRKTQPRQQPQNITRTYSEQPQNTTKTPTAQWIDTLIAKARNGNRNQLGAWAALVLKNEYQLPRSEAEQLLYTYQRGVETLGGDPYTETEMRATIRSIFKGH